MASYSALVALYARQLRSVAKVILQRLFKNMQSRLPRDNKEDTASEPSSDKSLSEDPEFEKRKELRNKLLFAPAATRGNASGFEQRRKAYHMHVSQGEWFAEQKKGGKTPFLQSKAWPQDDDEKGFCLLEEPYYLSCMFGNPFTRLASLFQFYKISDKAKQLGDAVVMIPDVWESLLDNVWDDVHTMFYDTRHSSALIDEIQKLTPRQRKIFRMNQIDIHVPREAPAQMPEEYKQSQYSTAQELSVQKTDKGRVIIFGCSVDSMYDRIAVKNTFPHVPKNYPFTLPKRLTTCLLLRRNIDDENDPWLIDKANFIMMP